MRFIIIVKASPASEAGVPPGASLVALAQCHAAMAEAGVLLDAAALQPSAQGWRMRYRGGERTLVEGPFTEAPALVAGYALIQVRSRDEALEWARRYPAPNGPLEAGEIEIRQVVEPDDAAPGASVDRDRDRRRDHGALSDRP